MLKTFSYKAMGRLNSLKNKLNIYSYRHEMEMISTPNLNLSLTKTFSDGDIKLIIVL